MLSSPRVTTLIVLVALVEVTLASDSPASRYPTGELVNSLLKQRARPYVVLVDGNLEVVLADPNALGFLQTQFQADAATSALPAPLRDAATELIRQWTGKGADPAELVVAVDGLLLRVIPMPGPQKTLYGLFVEKEVWREDLNDAMARFSFTPSEVEVLDLILNGMKATEIAKNLQISEVTVFGHFKHISEKMQARNRADMLAKVFNWQKRRRGASNKKEASSA
jgi:DNA-binding NarL/FixJ family response regulator